MVKLRAVRGSRRRRVTEAWQCCGDDLHGGMRRLWYVSIVVGVLIGWRARASVVFYWMFPFTASWYII